MKGSARLEGGVELAKALATLSTAVSSRLLRESVIEGAEPMRDRMEELAPRSEDAPHLRDQMVISVERGEDRREAVVVVGPTRKGFYGSFQEFGTAHHSAQPFARPAFDQTWMQSMAIIAAALWRDLAARGVHRPSVSVPTSVQGEV